MTAWRRVVTTIVLLAAVLTTTTAGRQAAPAAAGSLVEATVPAPALQGNLVGDPAQARVAVYLPPSYTTSPQRRYPTLYLLHGFLSDIDAFTRGYQGMQLATTMDDQIKRGAAREMIVVVASGRNAYFGSFYANSAVNGQWETFFAGELVSWVDSKYRTVTAAESRGIAGHSMGGYGAIMLAMKHPEVFGALYALSPCCVGLEGDLGHDNQAWFKALQIQSREQLQPKPRSFDDFYTTAFIALAAAVSPNPSKPPLFVDLPFKAVPLKGPQRLLVPNEDAYAKWRANMPLYLVEQYRGNLQKLRGIYLDYGALEEFSHIRTATRAFSEELANRGIAHTFEVYADGTHESRIRQRIETRVLRFFSEVLTFPSS
jgi:S-formylglutathione hydrolase FrmB